MSIFWLAFLLFSSFALLNGEMCDLASGDVEQSEINTFENNANEFVLQLFKNGHTDQPNLVFSPTSIAVTLGMLLEGAKGQTKTELIATLGQNVNEQNLARLFNRLVSRVNEESADYELSTANRIFVKNDFRISPNYTEKLERCFEAEAESIDVSQPTETADKINSWVAEKTKQKIKNLINAGAIQPDLALVLVNAIYFKAEWQTPFDTEHGGNTRAMNFNLLDGSQKETDFMTIKSRYLYSETEEVQVLGLPYKNGTLNMFVFLPKEGGFNDFKNSLTRENLTELMDGTQPDQVYVTFPKFKVEADFPLKTALEAMGMQTMFSNSADFSLMADRLKVTDAKHKAMIEVNEKGTEAAAATYIAMVAMSAGGPREKYFSANRPFLFAIRHNPTKSLLFFGRITDPTE